MRPFRAIIAKENVETDEGWLTRVFPAGCFEWGDGPWPMTVHHEDLLLDGTVLGRIDSIERLDTLILGRGVLDDEGVGAAADLRRDIIRQIDQKMINAISVEPCGLDVEETCTEEDADGWCTATRLTFTRYELGAASVVTIPAIEGTLIELDPVAAGPAPMEADAAAASAAAETDVIPAEWLLEPADLPDIDAADGRSPHIDGRRVFGYLCSWEDCYSPIVDRCQTPWRSEAGYAYAYHCGPFPIDDGTVRRLAPLAVQGGHYPTQGIDPATGERYARQWQAAQAHYDDPTSTAAYVAVGENEHGLWYSGALRQGVTDAQVALLRRHQLSGDYRKPGGPASAYELIGMCSVNFPGFIRQVAMVAAATPGEYDGEAAIIAGRRRPMETASCCEACTASGGHCDTHPEPSLEQQVAALRSMVETLARNTPGIREQLRARLSA